MAHGRIQPRGNLEGNKSNEKAGDNEACDHSHPPQTVLPAGVSTTASTKGFATYQLTLVGEPRELTGVMDGDIGAQVEGEKGKS